VPYFSTILFVIYFVESAPPFKIPADRALSLALLEAWVLFVDHIQFAFTAYDLAICTSFFDGCSNFHDESLLYF
jgi:hypothetical protein